MMTNAFSVRNRDIWHTTALTYNVSIVMNISMSQQIAQTKSHHQVHVQGTEIPILTQDATIDPHLTMTIKIGTIIMIIETDIDLAG